MTKINIGIDVPTPKKSCDSIKCPFHGNLKVRGNLMTGTIISSKRHNTVTIEWPRRYFVRKYERYERRNTKISVHSPSCLEAKEGDSVRIIGCKPLSKTKNFVIVENLGQVKGYKEIMEAREESKVKVEKKSPTEAKDKPQVEED